MYRVYSNILVKIIVAGSRVEISTVLANLTITSYCFKVYVILLKLQEIYLEMSLIFAFFRHKVVKAPILAQAFI